mmetsp:Transcript_12717/g.14159  ORF Transcript_12717/g.14159 Transcript_12717/m.14159 type:complete len:116 (-) Transcript_12717:606-953(-)
MNSCRWLRPLDCWDVDALRVNSKTGFLAENISRFETYDARSLTIGGKTIAIRTVTTVAWVEGAACGALGACPAVFESRLTGRVASSTPIACRLSIFMHFVEAAVAIRDSDSMDIC